MSRSRRKTPIAGITTAASEAEDKRIWHKRARAMIRQRITKESDPLLVWLRSWWRPGRGDAQVNTAQDAILDRMSDEDRAAWRELRSKGYEKLRLAHEIYMRHVTNERQRQQAPAV